MVIEFIYSWLSLVAITIFANNLSYIIDNCNHPPTTEMKIISVANESSGERYSLIRNKY